MEKTVILPGMWGDIDSDQIDEPQMAYGVVTHHDDHKRVTFSGSVHPEGGIEEQVRQILTHKEHALQDLGGSMDDVVRMQLFVRDDVLSRDAQTRIHEVRAEFFDSPHYPAATMVGVSALLTDDALVEIELEAEIPAADWETDVVTGE